MTAAINNSALTVNAGDLPEGFLATPLAQALCAAANEGREVSIDDAIDVVVEYGRVHQQAFDFAEQSEFLHEHPVFMSIPAVRVIARSPTFVFEYARLEGDAEEVSYFRETVIDDLVTRGDTRPAAEEVVKEAIALANAIASKGLSYGSELTSLAGFEEVPSTTAVIDAIVQH